MAEEGVAMGNLTLLHLPVRTVRPQNQKAKETVTQHPKLRKHQRHQRPLSLSSTLDQLFTQQRNRP